MFLKLFLRINKNDLRTYIYKNVAYHRPPNQRFFEAFDILKEGFGVFEVVYVFKGEGKVIEVFEVYSNVVVW